MTELKPCPFCGTMPSAFETTQGSKWGNVVCCHAEVRTGYKTEEHWRDAAIKTWNTRPIENALQQQIDRLTKERDEARKLAELYQDAAENNGNRLTSYLLETRGNGTVTIVGDGKLPWEKTDD